MNLRQQKMSSVILFHFMVLFILGLLITPTKAAAPQEINSGSQGIDVWKVQKRLYELNLYDGQITGVANRTTIEAIRRFQQNRGLSVTGNVDEQTADKLMNAADDKLAEKKSARDSHKRMNLSKKQVDLLTRLVYAESRGEPYKGQVAVAAVVLNRVQNPGFPKTIEGVIFQRGSFSVVRNGQLPARKNERAREAVAAALRGEDPSKGSVFFYNPDISTSRWIFSRPVVTEIGNHVFAK